MFQNDADHMALKYTLPLQVLLIPLLFALCVQLAFVDTHQEEGIDLSVKKMEKKSIAL